MFGIHRFYAMSRVQPGQARPPKTNGTCVRLASLRSARCQPHPPDSGVSLARPRADRGGSAGLAGEGGCRRQSGTAAVSFWERDLPCGVDKRPPPPTRPRQARYVGASTPAFHSGIRRCTQVHLDGRLLAQTTPVRLVRCATEQQRQATPSRTLRDIADLPTRAQKPPACWLVLSRTSPVRLVRRATERHPAVPVGPFWLDPNPDRSSPTHLGDTHTNADLPLHAPVPAQTPPVRLVRCATEQHRGLCTHAALLYSTSEDPRLKRERATGPWVLI